MRRALFGGAVKPTQVVEPQQSSTPSTPVRRSKALVSRLRVALYVTKTFEGPEEVFVHDANTLSTLIAEGEAKAAAKKKSFGISRSCRLSRYKSETWHHEDWFGALRIQTAPAE